MEHELPLTNTENEVAQRPKAGEYEAEDRELEEALGNIWDIAAENHLDPFPTYFEVAPADIVNQVGAYGIPGRMSHWTYGRQYRQMKTMYDYGLSKIYELVINSNPSQAFLLENNPPIANKFVMAHVLGHTDFFKNNYMFASTRRDMPDAVASSAARVQEYEDEEGRLPVEEFLDAALSIEQYIDPYVAVRPQRDEELAQWRSAATRVPKERSRVSSEFDDLFELPHVSEETARELGRVALQIPPSPDRDIVGFVRNHAPYLEDWQRDILDIVRGESAYFYPQRRTKIMNEGWAAYWHKRIMREMGDRNLISAEDDEEWWKLHSSVVAPGAKQLNPYYLGMKLYEYLEDYYNGHLTEKENDWLVEQGRPVYPNFVGDLKDSPAAIKLREVMICNDDQSFIRNYFDKNVAARTEMYIYDKKVDREGNEYDTIRDTGWEEVREKLVNMLDNSGTPPVVVVDGDYNHAGELYLRHEFDGRTLDPVYINKTLPYIFQLWQRTVHLETADSKGKMKRFIYDGKLVKTV